MYANEIITSWSYGKTEYTLHFCCQDKKLWTHYDAISQKNSDSKYFKKKCSELFHAILLTYNS